MKKRMRMAGLAIAVCFLLGLLPMSVFAASAVTVPDTAWRDYAADSFAGGTGTQEDPYQIATAEQLAKLAKDVNAEQNADDYTGKFFRLESDLDLSAHRWNPIGTYTMLESGVMNKSFRGFLDGNGKTITGMIVDERTEKHCGGLFGQISTVNSGDTVGVKNLTIKNAGIMASEEGLEEGHCGILVGVAMANSGCVVEISNVTVSGKISVESPNGNMLCGGMIGMASRVKATDCAVQDVEIQGGSNNGGFVGLDSGSEYQRCTASGKVSGLWAIGGFLGYTTSSWWQHEEEGSKFSYCLADVEVEGNDWRAGGFAGFAEYAQIAHCVSRGKVSSTVTDWEPKAGGFAGEIAKTKIANSHMAGEVTVAVATSEAGGFLGTDKKYPTDFDYEENIPDGMESTVENCSYDQEKNPTLKMIGNSNNALTGTVASGTTKEVLFNICEDYYESHLWEEEPTVDEEATCTEPGVESFHCKRCDAQGEKISTDPKGHTMQKVEEKPATCTEDGYEAYWICTTCQKLFSDESAETGIDGPKVLKAKGHSFGEWKVTKAATAKEKGQEERTCTVCRYKETKEIPALGVVADKKTATIQTGDESHVSMWMMISVVCLCVIAGLGGTMLPVKRRSKKK